MIHALLPALITVCVFLPSLGYEFVDYDDFDYIVQNTQIQSLNLDTLRYAFTDFTGANWHPLTMLSLALDWYLWGGRPFGFHFTSLLIHSCTVCMASLLFGRLLKNVALLDQASMKEPIPLYPFAFEISPVVLGTVFAALFFGIHPLRVESVVWISERKDVLSLLFIVTALWGYVRLSEQRSDHPGTSVIRFHAYWLVLVAACLAMLSKPLAVTLPVLLLLLDWYPFSRLQNRTALFHAGLEKIPLFIMSAICSFMTMQAQQIAMSRAPDVDAMSRFLLGCKALLFYLLKTIWPSDLTPMYPHPGQITEIGPEYWIYVVCICVIILLLLVSHNRAWRAIWLYYCISLAPMLGIIQVGRQWAADRYSYLPAIGVSILFGAGVTWAMRHSRRRFGAIAPLVCFVLVCCMLGQLLALTIQQCRVWTNTETMATRIIDQYPDDPEAPYYTRAKYYNERGDYDPALHDIDTSLAIALRHGQKSRYAEIYIAKADVLRNLFRFPEALAAADLALETTQGTPRPAHVAFRDRLAAAILVK